MSTFSHHSTTESLFSVSTFSASLAATRPSSNRSIRRLRTLPSPPMMNSFYLRCGPHPIQGWSFSASNTWSRTTPSPSRLLNWTCDVFPADGSTCTSSITLQKCRGDSQYSVGFWRVAGNSSCEKRGQLVQCANA